jgi:fibro-slime domain-containing protein
MNVRWTLVAACAALIFNGCSSSSDGIDTDDANVDGDGGPSPGGDGGGDPDANGPIPDGGGFDPTAVCGDGVKSAVEGCDDANQVADDGCSATCTVELGWECKVQGKSCARSVVCGDGQIGPGEVCDDMNVTAGDGCSVDCRSIETNFLCPTPGMSCISTMICGDGNVVGSEQCDDDNTVDGDGCAANCQIVEDGWSCQPGGRCLPTECGDGKRVGNEGCDDDNTANTDGCNEFCQVEIGWICPVGMPCRMTNCGDGTKEGTEQCDDGNDKPFDGCYKCQGEPNCGNEGCTAICGDGILFPGEACDDGNTVANDGCGPTCALEQGYACMNVVEAPPATLGIPIIYRDFRGRDLPAAGGLPAGHPDFEHITGTDLGIVGPMLGGDKKPVYAKGAGSLTTNGATAFNQWYNDTPNVNVTIPDTLNLTRNMGDGSYFFDSDRFFPLNDRGFRVGNREPLRNAKNDAGNDIAQQSFHFTSELRYWFEFGGGERLDFRGDDDVWVFVNGRRVIDIGGVHSAQTASVTLAAGQNGMTVGQIYEIVLFQAERHTTQSSYRLTLRGFEKKKTSCVSVCGDAVVTPDEVCDDGTAMNTGTYGRCKADCQGYGPRCGDNMVQAGDGELCDNGFNLGGYGPNGCAPGCKLSPRCGDGKVDGTFGEACDDGTNDGGYGECAPGCQLGERCGDEIEQPGEECDDGNNVASDGCDNACKDSVTEVI